MAIATQHDLQKGVTAREHAEPSGAVSINSENVSWRHGDCDTTIRELGHSHLQEMAQATINRSEEGTEGVKREQADEPLLGVEKENRNPYIERHVEKTHHRWQQTTGSGKKRSRITIKRKKKKTETRVKALPQSDLAADMAMSIEAPSMDDVSDFADPGIFLKAERDFYTASPPTNVSRQKLERRRSRASRDFSLFEDQDSQPLTKYGASLEQDKIPPQPMTLGSALSAIDQGILSFRNPQSPQIFSSSASEHTTAKSDLNSFGDDLRFPSKSVIPNLQLTQASATPEHQKSMERFLSEDDKRLYIGAAEDASLHPEVAKYAHKTNSSLERRREVHASRQHCMKEFGSKTNPVTVDSEDETQPRKAPTVKLESNVSNCELNDDPDRWNAARVNYKKLEPKARSLLEEVIALTEPNPDRVMYTDPNNMFFPQEIAWHLLLEHTLENAEQFMKHEDRRWELATELRNKRDSRRL